MITFINLLLAALALPALLASAYLLFLTLLSARLPVPGSSSHSVRFDVIVPAHNEAAVIERVIKSLSRVDWPPQLVRIIVVADNCDDSTANLARKAGVLVLERNDRILRGKGYVLQHAFDFSRESGFADAVIVVDADSEVSPNLLEAFAARIESGASAIQAYYGVLNPEESWRTRLITIAHGSFHSVRSRARERLKLSCGLRGNGWCVTHSMLETVPYNAFSMTEDLEYGIDLGMAGYRVHYAGEACANAEMASSEKVARQQRQRWEAGRFHLIRSRTLPLLFAAAQRRSLLHLDLALDLMVLPLSYIVINIVFLLGAVVAASLFGPLPLLSLWLATSCAAFILVYVLRGWQLSGRGARGLVDLIGAPLFVIWKLFLMVRRHDHRVWVPTRRGDDD